MDGYYCQDNKENDEGALIVEHTLAEGCKKLHVDCQEEMIGRASGNTQS